MPIDWVGPDLTHTDGTPVFIPREARYNVEISDALKAMLLTIYEHDCFVAGGFVRWLVSPHDSNVVPYGDIDIFGRTKEAAQNLHDRLLRSEHTTLTEETLWSWKLQYSPNPQETYTINIVRVENDKVYRTFGDPKEVVGRFDFTVTMAWIEKLDPLGTPRRIYTDSRFLGDELHHRLHFNVIKHPISALRRVLRYARKGYRMNMENMARFLLEAHQYQEPLEELVGWFDGEVELTQPELNDVYHHL
jgi:hypothetical protein